MYKNKKIKRSISFLLFAVLCAAVILSPVFMGSCGKKDSGNPAMTLEYGKNTTSFSSNIYSYYLSYTKTMMLVNLYMAYGYGAQDIPNMSDLPEYWATTYIEGITYGDMTKIQAEESLKNLLAVVAYCKENDLKLSKDEINTVDVAVKDLIKDYYGNSKKALNSVLIRFDIDDEIYKEILKYETLVNDVFGKYLFDPDTGKRKIPAGTADQIYQEQCVRVKHILIPYSPGTYDVNGDPEVYTEEEFAEVQARIDDLYDRIINGEDFDGLLEESADGMPFDGYTISEDTGFVQEFKDVAFSLEIGGVGKAESQFGMHIIKRYELLPADQATDIDTGYTWAYSLNMQMRSYITGDELKPYLDKIEVKKSETDLFSTSTSSVMLDCLELIFLLK